MKIEMERQDWQALADFINAANDAKAEIEAAIAEGKQQVSVKKYAIERLQETKVPAQVWIKLGALFGKGIEDEHRS